MRDRDLYATILGLQAPWTVERVVLGLEGHAVHVWFAREANAAPRAADEHPQGRASWAMKETVMCPWDYRDAGPARRFFHEQ